MNNNSTATSWRACKKIHPIAEIAPLMTETELRDLADDIDAKGIQSAILTCCSGPEREPYVIDGRNRLDACESLGWQLVDERGNWHGRIVPHIKYLGPLPDAEILSVVTTLNFRRKHYTTSQRAMMANHHQEHSLN